MKQADRGGRSGGIDLVNGYQFMPSLSIGSRSWNLPVTLNMSTAKVKISSEKDDCITANWELSRGARSHQTRPLTRSYGADARLELVPDLTCIANLATQVARSRPAITASYSSDN
jgi:hypothetical protein